MVLVFLLLMHFPSGVKVEVKRDGKVYFQEYKKGDPVKPVKEIGKTKKTETGNEDNFYA